MESRRDHLRMFGDGSRQSDAPITRVGRSAYRQPGCGRTHHADRGGVCGHAAGWGVPAIFCRAFDHAGHACRIDPSALGHGRTGSLALADISPAARSDYELAPVTQLDGKCSPSAWLDGQLYESLGQNREGFSQYRRRTDGMRCVAVPAAEATIGNPDPAAPADQRPLHRVELAPFLADVEPVSTSAYCRFLNSIGKVPAGVLLDWCGVDDTDRRGAQYPLKIATFGGWKPVRGAEQQPMMLVSWYGANAYSLWANRLDWRTYRGDLRVAAELRDHNVGAAPPSQAWLGTCLPSEAQWEYAARGSEPRPFPWGDGSLDSNAMCVARHRVGAVYEADNIPAANVHARLGLSPFGLHHMAANVWQWCRDWYSPDFYQQPQAGQANAQNGSPGHARSERGGSWVGPAELASSSYRRGRPPGVRGRCLGFRCVGQITDLP